MPAPKNETARAIGAKLEAARQHAAKLEADAKAMMDTAVAEDTLTTADFKAAYTEARKAVGEAKDNVSTLEGMFADAMTDAGAQAGPFGGNGSQPQAEATRETPGARFVNSALFKQLAADGKITRQSIGGETADVELMTRDEFKALITHDAGSAGKLVLPEIREGIVGLPQVPLTLLNLVNMTTTNSDLIKYFVETLFDNNAASIGEGDSYGESDFTFDERTFGVKKIGHVATTTWEMTQDAPRLEAWINRRMIYGALAELQRQIIAGAGAGEDLVGMYEWDGILSYELLNAETLTDGILKAIVAIEIASKGEITPTGIGINPLDYQAEVLTKDENKRYMYGGPLAPLPQTIWGLTPVRHSSFPRSRPLVAAFGEWEVPIRSGVTLSMSDSEGDNFRKDKVTYKARLRASAGTERAYAFCTVDPYSAS